MDKTTNLIELIKSWGYKEATAKALLQHGQVLLLSTEDPTDIFYTLKETDTVRELASKLKERPLYLDIRGTLIGRLELCSTNYPK